MHIATPMMASIVSVLAGMFYCMNMTNAVKFPLFRVVNALKLILDSRSVPRQPDPAAFPVHRYRDRPRQMRRVADIQLAARQQDQTRGIYC